MAWHQFRFLSRRARITRSRMEIVTVASGGFAPISSVDARVLVLGTLPGRLSLETEEYYAQPRNAFWRIVAELLGPVAELSYELRKQQLIENRIALWDVLASGDRVGSLDSRIKLSTAVPNDFRTFFNAHKHLELICFNGGMAAEIYERKVLSNLFVDMHQIPRRVLPSTSPANTTRFEQKLSSWRALTHGDIP